MSRWRGRGDVPRGDEYDAHFTRLADAGHHLHGEADLAAALVDGDRIVDAGCGTGRVAIELAARGFDVIGVDSDPGMLEVARRKAPDLDWREEDLVDLAIDPPADLLVLAGNVLIFVAPDTEATVVARCAAAVRPGGLVVAGFSVQPNGYGPSQLDAQATAAGLELVDRWSTWERAAWRPGDDYQVSVHRRVS